jgi:cytochrome c
MSMKLFAPVFAAVLMIASGAARADGDAEAGKKVFTKCAICHSTEAGQNKVGPSLAGVVGRPSASDAKFNYSEAMKKANLTWDDQTLDTYLTSPKQLVPGGKMVFVGLKDAGDRANVIAYLKTLK